MFKRDWETYMIKSVLAEREVAPWPKLPEEEIKKYKDDRLLNWQALVLHLPVPILSGEDVVDVMEVKQGEFRARLYPPMQLNQSAETSAAFEKTWLPEGAMKVDSCIRIDSSAVKGFVASHVINAKANFCQGMRIDEKQGTNIAKILSSLMAHICQQTGQWWLRGKSNPLKGSVRLGCEINKDFTLREVLRYSGAKQIESTWMGVDQRLAQFGSCLPLTNSLWLRCCHDVSVGLKPDAGLIAFYGAINHYMNNEDDQCVLSLAVAVEIMGNKNRVAKGKHAAAFPKLLQQSELIDGESKTILQKLYADRNHVAHGASAIHMGEIGEPTVEDYLNTVSEFKVKYLESFAPGDWHKLSQKDISVTRK